MSTASGPEESIPPAGPILLYLVSLLLLVVLRAKGWSGVLVWGTVCYLGAERLFPGIFLRHLWGALLSLFGAVVIIFLTALGLRPLAMLLFVPGVVLVGVLPLLSERKQRLVTSWPGPVLVLYVLATLGLYGFGAAFGPLPGINDDFLFALAGKRPPRRSLKRKETQQSMSSKMSWVEIRWTPRPCRNASPRVTTGASG